MAPIRVAFPEYFKDLTCQHQFDPSTGRPEGWMIHRDHIYLSATYGACADFYKLFGVQQ
jgi:hypothetical protein